MKKKKTTSLPPEFWREDAEHRRKLAERIAAGRETAEEEYRRAETNPEHQKRIEQRAQEILTPYRRSRDDPAMKMLAKRIAYHEVKRAEDSAPEG